MWIRDLFLSRRHRLFIFIILLLLFALVVMSLRAKQRKGVELFDALPMEISFPVIKIVNLGNVQINNVFALTSYDHIDIRTTVKQTLNFLRCFVASDDCADLRRQLGDEITDVLELRFPSNAYA